MRGAPESCSVVEINHQLPHRLEHMDLGGAQIDRDSLERVKYKQREGRLGGKAMEDFPHGAIEETNMEMAPTSTNSGAQLTC